MIKFDLMIKGTLLKAETEEVSVWSPCGLLATGTSFRATMRTGAEPALMSRRDWNDHRFIGEVIEDMLFSVAGNSQTKFSYVGEPADLGGTIPRYLIRTDNLGPFILEGEEAGTGYRRAREA